MKRQMAILLMIVAALLLQPAKSFGKSSEGEKTISIIFSHDMHSHMDAAADGRGGFAKLKTVAGQIKTEEPNSFMLDAGDFSMGTAYQAIFTREASELRMMGAVGFDATTLGNHEFDYRAGGLAKMLTAAVTSGETLPLLLCGNIDWEKTLADEEKREEAEKLKAACERYGVKPYSMIERGDARIAVFGIMGKEADEFAPESGLYFKDPVDAARELVQDIKEKENPELIVCLSHSGTGGEPKSSEDEILAEKVPDIDVIVSGHSHTELTKPIVAGSTVIASCGSYTSKLGHLVMRKNASGQYELADYELIPLDRRVEKNKAVTRELKTFRNLADKQYFSRFGYKQNDVLAENAIAFTDIEQFGIEQGEEPLGNLIADSYRYAISRAEGASQPGVDVSVVPAGVVRASFGEGAIRVADAFNVLSLGYGKDGIAGYPLVSAYLTGKELKAAAEVDATVSERMQVARLYMSGLAYRYNPNRLFLNRATDIRLDSGGGSYRELEDDKLYRVATDLYSCQMLSSVKAKSLGLLSIDPKDRNGNPIRDFESHIIYEGDKELKAWYALASYLESFEGGKIPDYYGSVQGRKTEIDSRTPAELLKQPNNVLFLALCAAVLLAAVCAGILLLIIKRRKKKSVKQ